jgi:flagellar biogenesis protein FliO
LRVLFAVFVLFCGSLAGAQQISAFPETPRPVRRLDAAVPVTLAGTPTATPAAFTIDPSKTPIRRIADDANDAAGPRSSWTVWFMLLALVGAAVGISFWTRRSGGVRHWRLPATVFQVLGKSSVGPNQSVTLLRLGERVLLVSSAGATMQTLAVVTDPVEVATITSECLSKRSVQLVEPPVRRTARPAAGAEGPAVAGSIDGSDRLTARSRSEVNRA